MTYPNNQIPSTNPQNIGLATPIGLQTATRAPTSQDTSFPPGYEWLNSATGTFYKCISSTISGAVWGLFIPSNAFFTFTSITSASSPYTVLPSSQFISVNTSGGAITIDLPNSMTTGQFVYIKDASGNAFTNNITVTTVGGSVTIDGATSYTINVNYMEVAFVFNGSAYEVF